MRVRKVAGSVVVTVPQSVLDVAGLKPGDRVSVEAAPPGRIVITKERQNMQSTARVKLEIELLERTKRALESDLSHKSRQYEKNMLGDEGVSDPDTAVLMMSSTIRDRDRLDVKIAEKKLELYDLAGGELASDESVSPVSPAKPTNAVQKHGATHAEQIARSAIALAGANGDRTFSRKTVREHLGLNNRDWQSSYTAIFQAMRDDHPGGAPKVATEYVGVFHRVSPGTYQLSPKGRLLARRFGNYTDPVHSAITRSETIVTSDGADREP